MLITTQQHDMWDQFRYFSPFALIQIDQERGTDRETKVGDMIINDYRSDLNTGLHGHLDLNKVLNILFIMRWFLLYVALDKSMC